MKLKTMFVAFAFAALALSLGSCKKDYSCVCTTTTTAGGASSSISTTTTINDTKKKAKDACDGLSSSTSMSKTDCEIK